MLKLLGRSTSINVRKVLWACAEMQLEVEHEQWGGADLRSPAFLALNPNAMVPVLRDGDLVMWESNAICRYLAMREGRDDLLPSVARDRAHVEQWMDWQATELNNAWRYAFLALVRKNPDYGDPRAIATSTAQWNRHMHILDGQLMKTDAYVTGPAFTLADVVLGLSAYRWTMTPMERPSLPAVEAWLGRIGQRAPYLTHGANGTP